MGDFELVTAADVRLMQGPAGHRGPLLEPAQRALGAPGHPNARGLYYGAGFRPLSRDVPLIKPAV